MEQQVILPDVVWGTLAGIWVAVTAFFGISWFRDLSARVRHLEDQTAKQEIRIAEQDVRIAELKIERAKLRARLEKYGIDEESEPL